MEKERQISLEGRDVELGAAIRYDYYPGGEFGEACDEEYINVFRGDRHIFVTRYYDEGDPNPKYMITETDLKTNEQRSYRCDLRSESTLDEAKAIVISELTEDLRGFIAQNYGDVVSWVGNAIEASIYKLKN